MGTEQASHRGNVTQTFIEQAERVPTVLHAIERHRGKTEPVIGRPAAATRHAAAVTAPDPASE